MNKVSKLLASVAMAAAALWAPNASANFIFNGIYTTELLPPTNTTYIGQYLSTNKDHGAFVHDLEATGTFTDTWVFDFSPIGSASTNANFDPTAFISGFTVQLYNAAATCTTSGAACSSYTQGPLIATGIPVPGGSNIDFTALAAGFYGIVVTGDVSDLPVTYSGQMHTSPIPEPASLALVGVALLGLALSGKKRKSV